MVFKVLIALAMLYSINICVLFGYNLLNILKIITETHLKIPSSLIGRCSLVPISHWMQ